MTYAEQLKSPKWQRKRLEILERDNLACIYCMDSESQLHVHHGAYLSKLMLWEYPDEMLHTLCFVCHADITQSIYRMNTQFGSMSPSKISIDFIAKICNYMKILSDSDMNMIDLILERAVELFYYKSALSKHRK